MNTQKGEGVLAHTNIRGGAHSNNGCGCSHNTQTNKTREYLVVADEVKDGVKAHVVNKIILGLAAF